MRSRKILFTLLITSMFILPFINFATAASTPNYVTIDKDDEIIWDVYFDDDPVEDYLEDVGYPETYIDDFIDDYFKDERDTDVVGWKIKILKLENEDDEDGDKYVKYKYRLSTKDEDEDWEVEDEKDSQKIWKYDTDVYVDLALISNQNWFIYGFPPYGLGLFQLVVADNVNWEKLAGELDDEADDDFDGNDEQAGAEVATDMYFFMQRANGISTYTNHDEDDLEDFTSTAQFTDNGVLLYYNYAYDGDTIIEFKLQYRMVYQWWWAGVVVALAAVVIVIVIIILKKR